MTLRLVRSLPVEPDSLGALADEVRALARRQYDPTGRESPVVGLTLCSGDEGGERYRAAVWTERVAPPLSCEGATPRDAMRALLAALHALAALDTPPSSRGPRRTP